MTEINQFKQPLSELNDILAKALKEKKPQGRNEVIEKAKGRIQELADQLGQVKITPQTEMSSQEVANELLAQEILNSLEQMAATGLLASTTGILFGVQNAVSWWVKSSKLVIDPNRVYGDRPENVENDGDAT
jgi:hypothetical protein